MTDRDIDILARTVFAEARGESHLGRVAVAHVVRNRWLAQKRNSGDTIAETCLKPYQFSCWNNSRSNEANHARMLSVTLDDKAFAECYWAALGVILGREHDPTSGADFYHVSDVHPRWAHSTVSQCTIGRHIFYRINR